jgi:hypothetical protein
MKEQTLIQGELPKIRQEIVSIRNNLRANKGWILDVYKLQRIIDSED